MSLEKTRISLSVSKERHKPLDKHLDVSISFFKGSNMTVTKSTFPADESEPLDIVDKTNDVDIVT